MKRRMGILAILSLLTAPIATSAHIYGQTALPQQPQTQTTPPARDLQTNMMNMMGRMKATDPKLDELVKKMNAATGSAKIDAMAELLTAFVEDRRTTSEPMMSNLMSMMNMMGQMHMMGGQRGTGQNPPTAPK